jgi:GTP-binding protein
VQAGDRTFVLADIPGLIEGAHEGHGLGMQFLRHIERTRLLVHLVDVSDFSGRNPANDFDVILEELKQFNEEVAAKPMLVVASKIDVCQDSARLDAVRQKASEHELPFYAISSATGTGIEELRFAISDHLLGAASEVTLSVGS